MTEDDSDICSICLEKIQSSEDLWTCLKCSNRVHKICFNEWKLKQNTCPYCRNDNESMGKKDSKNKLCAVSFSLLIFIIAIYFNDFYIVTTPHTQKNSLINYFQNNFT